MRLRVASLAYPGEVEGRNLVVSTLGARDYTFQRASTGFGRCVRFLAVLMSARCENA